MKVYIEEYNWQNDIRLTEVELYGIRGDWYEDYEEHGGLFFSELFTSYRHASEFLLSLGYIPVPDSVEDTDEGVAELEFYVYHEYGFLSGNIESVYIEKMEVVK